MEFRYYNSTALTDHFIAEGDSVAIAHAKAFGAAWAYLDQNAKAQIFRNYGIEIPESKEI